MDLEGRKAWNVAGCGLFVLRNARVPDDTSQVPPHILMPCVAHTSPLLGRDVWALGDRRSEGTPIDHAFAQPAKNAKNVETNSASLLESIKPEKNELKTNSNVSKKLFIDGANHVTQRYVS